MKNIKGYVNLKSELNLINLNIEAITKKEEYLKTTKMELKKLATNLEIMVNKIENELKKLKGVEKELLTEIVVKGKNVTRAVDVVSFTYDMDPSTIWKNYYPKVKKILISLDLL